MKFLRFRVPSRSFAVRSSVAPAVHQEVLEERVDNLETIFGRFIINNDKTLRRLENMMFEMRQQAEQDRQRAEQDREQTKQILFPFSHD